MRALAGHEVLALHSELGVLWGGGETFTTNLLVAFADRGHRVTAAFVADHRGRYPRALPASFEVLPVSGWWSRKLGQAALSSLGAYLPGRLKPKWDRLQEALCWRTIRWHNGRFQRRIEDTFASRWDRYDAVYVHGNVGLAHGAALHRPTLLMLPGPVSDDCVPQLRNVHAVCAHDDGLSCMRSLLGDDAIELPLGLDSQLFNPGRSSVRTELGWSGQDLVIGYVGRLAFIKGVDLLAAAFAEISRRRAERQAVDGRPRRRGAEDSLGPVERHCRWQSSSAGKHESGSASTVVPGDGHAGHA